MIEKESSILDYYRLLYDPPEDVPIRGNPKDGYELPKERVLPYVLKEEYYHLRQFGFPMELG